MLDFVGDTVISTHAQIESMRSPVERSGMPAPTSGQEPAPSTVAYGRDNSTGLQEASRLAATTQAPGLPEALTPNESWLGRGGLDRKIEIIIRGVAADIGQSSD